MNAELIFWLVFIAVYLIVFFIDMFVTNHRKKTIEIGTALKWSVLWISVAMLYGVAILLFFPQNPLSSANTKSIVAIKYFAGYLTEYSLSIDNLFVFIMIFSLMGVAEFNQPRLLKLGILLSIVLRILFIVVGMELIERFHFIIYIFGIILLWTAYKMAFTNEDEKIDPQKNFLYKTASRLFPVDPDTHASYFFRFKQGKLFITSVLLVFLVIGSTDVLFAIDSIPAIIGVIKEGTKGVLTIGEEQFIAITSNTFAVMGLVSLFFALKGIMKLFRYLKQGVSFILFFIGAKMLLGSIKVVEEWFQVRPWISLTVILSTLVLSVLVSIIIEEIEEAKMAKEELEHLKKVKNRAKRFNQLKRNRESEN